MYPHGVGVDVVEPNGRIPRGDEKVLGGVGGELKGCYAVRRRLPDLKLVQVLRHFPPDFLFTANEPSLAMKRLFIPVFLSEWKQGQLFQFLTATKTFFFG